MSSSRTILFSLGFGVLSLVTACGSDKSTSTGGSGGSGSDSTSCGTIDYSSYAGGTPVSLKSDLMPIFGMDCTASLCHSASDKRAGLNLGTSCSDVTNGECTFATTVDPNKPSAKPLTQDLIDAVYASLTAKADTVNQPDASASVKRVMPGDPEHSFLIQKLADTESAQGYACTNQDDSHEPQPAPACGEFMPQGGLAPLCAGKSRPKFDLIARWIAQGAENN